MGIKLRWRKHICAVAGAPVNPGSMPLARIKRCVSCPRIKAMKL